MLTRRISTVALGWSLLVAVIAAWAQQGGASGPAAADARAWLLRIQDAANRQNFQGTFVISGGGNVAAARMAHFCEGPNQYERIESLDGQARNVYRWNEIVHTLWPAGRVAVIEPRDPLNSFPAVLQAGDDALADWYEVQPLGADRVAGRDASVLLVRPKDAFRYGYRLWADRASGLLLRADVLGERGQVLETSAFSDIAIGIKPQPDSVLQPMKRLEGFRVVRPTTQPTRLDLEGWNMRQVAPGFRLVSCVNREMEAPGDAEATGGAQRVLQAIYADGMTYVSVFIEPFRPQRHAQPMLTAVGATRTLSMRQGDWWITVVGDAPAATLRLFAGGLERRK
jgi:sigma-E factor negative regulatory protein RseB